MRNKSYFQLMMNFFFSRLPLLCVLISVVACNDANKTSTKNSTTSIVDDNFYSIDYRLQPDMVYSMTYSDERTIKVKNSENIKTKQTPVSTTEKYTMSTREKGDTILLVLSHDTTLYNGTNNRNTELKKDSLSEKTTTGFSVNDKKISFYRTSSSNPSRKVWTNQDSRPRGKMKIGETYTFHRRHYNSDDGHEKIDYFFKQVRDSIAFFEMKERTFQRGESQIHQTATLEYDLRKNIYRRIEEHENSETSIDNQDKSVSIGRVQKRTYTIDSTPK